MVQFDEEKQETRLSEFRKHEQEHLAERLAEKHGLPYTDLSVTSPNPSAVSVLPEKEARRGKMVVFDKVNKNIKVGVLSPDQKETREILETLKSKGFIPDVHVVSEESLALMWKRYETIKDTERKSQGSFDITKEVIEKLRDELQTIEDIDTRAQEATTKGSVSDTSSILEIILAGALKLSASDIHFEPTENDTRLRYRVDGALLDVTSLPQKAYSLILSRIKLLSSLKINVVDKAQDGRFSINIGDTDIEIRTSLIPGAYGESIVLRVLDPENISVPLEDMGMHPRLFEVFLEEIKKPNGMILTTGPTGSGKTTTLYASLRKIYDPERKILTIENPIEYHLEGIVQTQTDHKRGYTFSEGLRSALRQDPDVIMVGEIRDEETAEIAINAALTGHLVFSTLHTNNAAGTFPRLIDLGVNDKTISSAVNLSMAQRLVRKLCPHCKEERPLDETEKEIINSVLETVPDNELIKDLQREKVWEGGGCEECHGTGYKGRIGIFEAIRVDASIEEVVIQNPSEREIKEAAKGQGIPTIQQDGVIKVLKGITSYKEVSGIVALQGL